MPERLSDDEWARLLREESDAFRLTIRAWAALEAEIDALTEQLFRAPIDGGMKGLGTIYKRISVASALGVVPRKLAPTLHEIRLLRNDFAHGDIEDIEEPRADAIVKVMFESRFIPDELRLPIGKETPRRKLELTLTVLRSGIKASGNSHYQRQMEAEQALAVQRAVAEQVKRSTEVPKTG